MRKPRPGARGWVLRIQVNIDVSGATGFVLSITKPDGTTVERTAVTVGAVDASYTRDDGAVVRLKANHYVEYTAVVGDFPESGKYVVALRYDSGDEISIPSDPVFLDI